MEYLHNNNRKIAKINAFMDELLNNKTDSKSDIYKKYESVINEVSAMDLFYLNMYKHHTNFSIEEIKQSADKFVNVFHKALSEQETKDYNHIFLKLLYKESLSIEAHLQNLKHFYQKQSTLTNHLDQIKAGFQACIEIEKKFVKLENILFPHLEGKLPSETPLKVLWSLHDDARKQLKIILQMLSNETINNQQFYQAIGTYYFLIYGINLKEQLILFPVALDVLSKRELDAMYNESLEFGYAFNLEKLYPIDTTEDTMTNFLDKVFKAKTGTLKFDELEIILNILPVDITYCDADNKVKYFNDTTSRIFPRSASIIGRDVKNCHPPKSIHIVEKIIESFKNGERDKADFWLQFNDKMIYIVYLALRDNTGKYLGVLEISQDITHVRSLTGEKRLLSWE